MARKKIHEIPVGPCSVRVYRDSEFGEYVVKTLIKGKTVGGKGGGYFTNDKADAYTTARVEASRLGNRSTCRASGLGARQEMRSLRSQGIPKGVRVVLKKKPR